MKSPEKQRSLCHQPVKATASGKTRLAKAARRGDRASTFSQAKNETPGRDGPTGGQAFLGALGRPGHFQTLMVLTVDPPPARWDEWVSFQLKSILSLKSHSAFLHEFNPRQQFKFEAPSSKFGPNGPAGDPTSSPSVLPKPAQPLRAARAAEA